MAKSFDPIMDRTVRQLKTHYGMYDKIQILELEKENKRLKQLAHDLQKEMAKLIEKEIEFMVLESRETHELEEK